MQHLIAESLSLSKSSIGSEAAPPMMRDMKSVEFSYEDLAAVTDNFHVSHKIGQGGFASVYYGVIYDQVNSTTYLIERDFTTNNLLFKWWSM